MPTARLAAPAQSIGNRGPRADGRITRQARRAPKKPKGVEQDGEDRRHPKAAIRVRRSTSPMTGAPVMAIWNQPMAWTRWLSG